ncbi:hypothetical protein LTR85_006978 [Meristemomyces frigidus]|nr:hypothetical protein LTR85_006978 [Meristemomyces frigidus]
MPVVRKVETSPPLPNVNGATYHNGALYAATNGGSARYLYRVNITTGEAVPILNNYRGRHLNSPNDLIFDAQSNIYFTDPPYGAVQQWPGVQEPELPNGIYHFNTMTKALTALCNSVLQMPNGLALSTDERTLYVADSNSSYHSPTSVRNVWAFDVQAKGTLLTNQRLVYQAECGWPDGIRVSRNGYLFVSAAGGVDVMEPSTGLLLGKINTPGDIIYNLELASGNAEGV